MNYYEDEYLYHFTMKRNLPSIMKKGLIPYYSRLNRQYFDNIDDNDGECLFLTARESVPIWNKILPHHSVLLRIKRSDLDPEKKVYPIFSSDFYDTVYYYGIIPPELIEVVELDAKLKTFSGNEYYDLLVCILSELNDYCHFKGSLARRDESGTKTRRAVKVKDIENLCLSDDWYKDYLYTKNKEEFLKIVLHRMDLSDYSDHQLIDMQCNKYYRDKVEGNRYCGMLSDIVKLKGQEYRCWGILSKKPYATENSIWIQNWIKKHFSDEALILDCEKQDCSYLYSDVYYDYLDQHCIS